MATVGGGGHRHQVVLERLRRYVPAKATGRPGRAAAGVREFLTSQRGRPLRGTLHSGDATRTRKPRNRPGHRPGSGPGAPPPRGARVSLRRVREDGVYGQPTCADHLAVSPPARRQPRRLVALVARGVRGGQEAGCARAAQCRVRQLPLVSRHGARVVRGRDRGRLSQRALRAREGRPGGAARRRRRLHGGRAGGHRARGVADDRLSHPGRRTLLLRDLLPARGPARLALLSAGAGRGHRRLDRSQGRGRRGGGAYRRRSRGAVAGPWWGRGAGGVGDRSGAARADPGVRRAARRVRGCAQVSAGHGGGVPAAALCADRGRRRPADGRRHLLGDGPGRHLRPARRRVRAVLRGPGVDRAALREDAVRQRSSVSCLRSSLAYHRVRRGAADRPGDRRLHGAGAADRRGRVRLCAGRRQ
ncbi:hypothetical protein SFIMM107S_05923 [Streptomyces griseus]